jgi:hypothetical protein
VASTTSKVVTGCSIGCLLLLLLSFGLTWMGYRWAREAADVVEATGRVGAEVEKRFGEVRDYTPPPSFGVPADRMELFLAVRDALAEPRAALEDTVADLESDAGRGGVLGSFRAARSVIGMAPLIVELIGARDQALLDHGMGLGEYTWIYWLTYTAWLGHPVDESALHEFFEARSAEDESFDMHLEGMETERLTWRIRSDVTAMLESLAGELESVPEREALRQAVASELAALEADPARVPFQDGLADALAEGLEPYRERLEATYSRAANPFELGQLD